MSDGGLLHLWNRWGIQFLVLASFMLQVFLLVVGGIRRRSSSTFLRITLWFAYLLADSTAIYTLGHLSVASKSGEHQLAAFWAPFLLLHLGGPDNITAYSLEDNRLWLRHLQTLAVQVLGAAYVIYRYMVGEGTLLLMASISMFVAGLIKYGERTWALKCGNISSIRGSLYYFDYHKGGNPCRLLRQDMSEEDVLLLAHSSFSICKSVFTDFPIQVPWEKSSPVKCVMNQYKLVEMELSLMYDILYTKAAVIHTWYGLCIHLISLLGTGTTFLLFQLSISSSRNGYSRLDVIVSYILLVGALALEAISFCRVLLSSWTHSLLHCRGKEWERFLHVLTFLRRRVQPASGRLWAGSIGQYNLFHLCTRDSNKLVNKLMMIMGIQDWWNKLHFSGTFSPTNSLSTDDLMELVFRAVPELPQHWSLVRQWDPNGRSILKKKGVLMSVDPVFFGVDFNECILTWHIATEVYIRTISKVEHEEKITEVEYRKKLVEATEALSNYMMYLMVVKSDMMPDPRPQNAHVDLCMSMDALFYKSCAPITGSSQSIASRSNRSFADKGDPVVASHRSWNPYYILKKQFNKINEFFHHDGPDGSRILERENLVAMLNKDEFRANFEIPKEHMRSSYHERVLRFGADQVVKGLLSETISQSEMMEIIFAVWVELLLYAGDRCSRESHARQLSNGGEFITILWLMMKHANYYAALYRDGETLRTIEEDDMEHGPIRGQPKCYPRGYCSE